MRKSNQKPIKAKVHIVTKWLNSPWPEDTSNEIVKVFKGARKSSARKWALEQEKACRIEYRFNVETWEID